MILFVLISCCIADKNALLSVRGCTAAQLRCQRLASSSGGSNSRTQRCCALLPTKRQWIYHRQLCCSLQGPRLMLCTLQRAVTTIGRLMWQKLSATLPSRVVFSSDSDALLLGRSEPDGIGFIFKALVIQLDFDCTKYSYCRFVSRCSSRSHITGGSSASSRNPLLGFSHSALPHPVRSEIFQPV